MNQEQIQVLVDKADQEKDPAAFAQLVSGHQELVFRLAFRLLCNESEARDMVQETFLKVWLSLDKYDRGCRFSTWIYKIASNTCYDRLRVLQHTPTFYSSSFTSAELDHKADTDIEQSLVNENLKELILRFTSDLTPRQKLVFTLRDIEGLDVAEVETITGLSAGKIKSNLYQARKQIREKINQIER